MYYQVTVIDHITGDVVTVGQLRSRAEAVSLVRFFGQFQFCDVEVKEFHWYSKKKGKVVEV